MTPGEALVARIFNYVKTVVPPELVEPVTKATAEAIVVLMNDPGFTAELRVVNDLRQENQWLKVQNVHLQRILSVAGSASTSPPRKRASTSKKASPKRAPSSRPSTRSPGGTASRSAKANFVKGVRQAKRTK